MGLAKRLLGTEEPLRDWPIDDHPARALAGAESQLAAMRRRRDRMAGDLARIDAEIAAEEAHVERQRARIEAGPPPVADLIDAARSAVANATRISESGARADVAAAAIEAGHALHRALATVEAFGFAAGVAECRHLTTALDKARVRGGLDAA